MTQTRRVAVFGSRPPSAYESRLVHRNLSLQRTRVVRSNVPGVLPPFMCYDDSDEEDGTMSSAWLCSSNNLVDYVRSREYGMRERRSIDKNQFTTHLLRHELLRERPIRLGLMDKVLCSQWLDSAQIIFGTRCNKLMVYNVKSHKINQIPSMVGRINEAADPNWGIYSIKINPSRTLLATGAYNSKEIAVYRIPSLDPVYLAENAHTDWVNDIEWLDDELFVSGSHDSNLALWHVKNEYEEQFNDEGVSIKPDTQFVSPKIIHTCKTANDVRSIIYNNNFKEILTLSTNGYAHIWDVERFRQRYSRKLLSNRNAMCMSMKNDGSVFAVGCHSNTLLHDSRMLSVVKKIQARYDGCGIKSLSFKDNILTIGTGIGVIMFYDIRAGKYLESIFHKNKAVLLKSSDGYLDIEDEYLNHHDVQLDTYKPAIFTHCYDHSGTRLFSGGGPIHSELCGNYAGLWE